MSKINVLVIPSDTEGGVGFYRSVQPHIQLEHQFPDDFSVTIEPNPNWGNLSDFDKYDIIHIHKGLYQNMPQFMAAMNYFKSKNIVTIMDIDDHWKLGPHHPQYASQTAYKTNQIIASNLRIFDYVTTTTPIFANEIKRLNPNVKVFPNAINPEDERFTINKPESKLIRIGLIMGSSHEYDMDLLKGMVNRLPQSVKDKVQFVLCGYDLRGTMRMINQKTGESKERPIMPKETVWYRYEQNITDNYKIVSPQYRQFLEKFMPNVEWPNVENEHYRRCWTKDMNHYYQHYNNVDILLAPIETAEFNKMKSQLKVIECAFSNTAIIASDFGPYQIDLVPYFEKGNVINPEGNACLVKPGRDHKDWAKYIQKLVENPEIIKTLQTNLHNTICEKYDLRNVTKERAEFYKNIVKKD